MVSDKKYYEEMVTWNKGFLIFKDRLTAENSRLRALYGLLLTRFTSFMTHDDYKEIINEMLDMYPDKKSREGALKFALKVTKSRGLIHYQEPGHKAYLQLDSKPIEKEIGELVIIANKITESIVDYLTMFKKILSKKLPLKPYKDWLIREEKQAQHTIKMIESLIEGSKLDIKTKLNKLTDLQTDITDEDVEDFKRAGL